ncbi:MAG: hypothetical protein BM485_01225 [Desulfobulbaceae bacterium DB1]|nr:MAG: hypothetical protein BM485_01225 [Desulfobulbaceae bacterium DB1]
MVFYSEGRKCTPTLDEKGYSLVELMIVVAVSGVIMAGLAMVYSAQSKSYSAHDDVANIQQDLRGALAILTMEIRKAGCDPTESNSAGILVASLNHFRFTMDIRGNAVNANSADGDVDDVDEDIAYGFQAGQDTNNDGIVDNGGAAWSGAGTLGRQTGNAGGFQGVANNIDALEFNYMLNDGTTTLTPPDLSKIRAVQVSLLARSANPAQDFLNTNTYTAASGVVWDPPDDNFRRRLVVATIQCRNMEY